MDRQEYYKIYLKIAKGEKTLTQIAKEIGMTRNKLVEIIDQNFCEDINYGIFQKRLRRKQQTQTEHVEKAEKGDRDFLLAYCKYKNQDLYSKDLINKMGAQGEEEKFYERIESIKRKIREGKILFSKTEFSGLTEEFKKLNLYSKVNQRRKNMKCYELSQEEFNNRLQDLMNYFLIERNRGIQRSSCTISKEELYKLLFSNIAIIDFDIDKNVKASAENIDRIIGRELGNLLMKSKPNVFSLSEQKVEELLCLVIDERYLETYIRSDDRWSSGERVYALLQYAKKTGRIHNQLNWIDKQASRTYTKEELLEKYPYPKEYEEIGKKVKRENDEWSL